MSKYVSTMFTAITQQIIHLGVGTTITTSDSFSGSTQTLMIALRGFYLQSHTHLCVCFPPPPPQSLVFVYRETLKRCEATSCVQRLHCLTVCRQCKLIQEETFPSVQAGSCSFLTWCALMIPWGRESPLNVPNGHKEAVCLGGSEGGRGAFKERMLLHALRTFKRLKAVGAWVYSVPCFSVTQRLLAPSNLLLLIAFCHPWLGWLFSLLCSLLFSLPTVEVKEKKKIICIRCVFLWVAHTYSCQLISIVASANG